MDENHDKLNVGIISTNTFLERSGTIPLNNLIAIVSPLTNKLFVIIGGEGYENSTSGVEIIRIKAKQRSKFLSKVLEQILIHVRELRLLFKLRRSIDILIFFHGTPFPVPLLFAQVLNMKCFIILVTLGSAADIRAVKESGARQQSGQLIKLSLSAVLERISYFFADRLIVYGPSTIEQADLGKYRKKTVVAHRHFLDFDQYRFRNNIEKRDNVVGYVGRINEVKGIRNFVQAVPKVLSARNDVTFLIAGEGHLEDEIRAYLDRYNLQGKVTFAGWISHRDLPNYLANLKLLVIPSYNEGLPNVMLEAMACGTPVLATSVASVPDVIRDKENGFLIYDNSPSCVAKNIVTTLQYPHLKRITINARNLVESEFRYEKVAEIWGRIIYDTENDYPI
jgi:glycosyltransferase involved in cell wall biosynthesis